MKSTLAALAVAFLGASSATAQSDRWQNWNGPLPPAGATKAPTVSEMGGTSGPLGCAVNFEFDRPTFEANNPDLCNLETFEASSAGGGGVGVHEDPVWACSSDLDFAPNDIQGAVALSSSALGDMVTLAAGLVGNSTIVCGANLFDQTTVLEFNDEPTAVGFEVLEPFFGTVDINVFDCDGNRLGSTSLSGAFLETFVGITTNFGCPGIFRVEIQGPGDGVNFGGELVDDVTYNGVCETVLGPDFTNVTVGGLVSLGISEATDPSRGLMFITSVDGIPFSQLVFGPFGVPGVLCIGPVNVPPAPSGTKVGLTSFLLDNFGTISATNEAKVIIN